MVEKRREEKVERKRKGVSKKKRVEDGVWFLFSFFQLKWFDGGRNATHHG